MNKISKILILIVVFFNSAFGVQRYTLEVSPGVQHEITSAYPYKHLSKEEKAKAYTVLERTYTILDSSANIAIVPNLNPCICIVVHYGTKAAVFHHHFSSSINDLIAKAKAHLGINESTNPGEVKIYIYAFKAYNFNTVWKARYQNRTQEAELAQIKRNLMQGFGITEGTQVEDCLWTPNEQDYENYRNYYGLDTSIVVSMSVENELTIYNTSLVHEEVFFKNQYREGYEIGDTILRHTMTKMIQSYAFDKYQDGLLTSTKYSAFYDEIRRYGAMPYMRALHLKQYLYLTDITRLGGFLRQTVSSTFGTTCPDIELNAEPIPCYVCGKVTTENSRCANCREYHYCSKECQRTHWHHGHREECRGH